ncbi:TPA: ribbon-helix-helix domain-containing protein [Aeromonas hydrophila]|uniref:ribbon-helix-helix domain-containing protein n=1 Tax=Aeromonas hydrophila TaxID=644 RepID=UPI0018AFCFC4|nr:ribbon-helix-helix domain-containing protein [Aeromonas hydrophila]
MKSNKDASIRVRIDSDVEASLKRLCEFEGVNSSVLIRRLIDAYVALHPETKVKVDVSFQIKNLPEDNIHAWYVFLVDADLKTENLGYDLTSIEIPFLLPEFFDEDGREPFRVDSFYYHRMYVPNSTGRKGRFIGAKIMEGKWKGAIYVYKNSLLDTPDAYESEVKRGLSERIKFGVIEYIRSQLSSDFSCLLNEKVFESKNEGERY